MSYSVYTDLQGERANHTVKKGGWMVKVENRSQTINIT